MQMRNSERISPPGSGTRVYCCGRSPRVSTASTLPTTVIPHRKKSSYDEFDVHTIELAVDVVDEDGLCLLDPTRRLSGNAPTLVNQLEAHDRVRGVGGTLIEPEQNRIRYEGYYFSERDGGKTFVRSPQV